LIFGGIVLLQGVVLWMFLAEEGDPPGGGISMDLWVDSRRELVWAFLGVVFGGAGLTILFLLMTTGVRRRFLRGRVICVAVLVLWVVYGGTMWWLAGEKIGAVADVAWRYVIGPRVEEAMAGE